MFARPPRHVRQTNSAGVDGGLSGGSIVSRPGREAPVEIINKNFIKNNKNNFKKLLIISTF